MEGRGNVFPNPYWKLCLCLIPPSSLDLNNSHFSFPHWPFPIAAHPSSEHLAFEVSHRKHSSFPHPPPLGYFLEQVYLGSPKSVISLSAAFCCHCTLGYPSFSLKAGVFLFLFHIHAHSHVCFKSFSFMPALPVSSPDKDNPLLCSQLTKQLPQRLQVSVSSPCPPSLFSKPSIPVKNQCPRAGPIESSPSVL